MCRLLCSEQSPTFFPEKEAISLKNVVNKRYIIKSQLKHKFIMMCFQGPLICYIRVESQGIKRDTSDKTTKLKLFTNYYVTHMFYLCKVDFQMVAELFYWLGHDSERSLKYIEKN